MPGTSTRADVTALIGSPTARATFDENSWLYVGEVTRPGVARTRECASQTVVVVTFNDKGVLRNQQELGRRRRGAGVGVARRPRRRAARPPSCSSCSAMSAASTRAAGPRPQAAAARRHPPTEPPPAGARAPASASSPARAITGGSTTRFSASQPPVASIAPEANAVRPRCRTR